MPVITITIFFHALDPVYTPHLTVSGNNLINFFFYLFTNYILATVERFNNKFIDIIQSTLKEANPVCPNTCMQRRNWHHGKCSKHHTNEVPIQRFTLLSHRSILHVNRTFEMYASPQYSSMRRAHKN